MSTEKLVKVYLLRTLKLKQEEKMDHVQSEQV